MELSFHELDFCKPAVVQGFFFLDCDTMLSGTFPAVLRNLQRLS
jgi:hypothetical protein